MLNQTFPLPLRFAKSYARARTAIGRCLFAFVIALLPFSMAHAQGGVPLVTVATDQSPLNLSNQFGVPAGSAINQAGDFAFVGNGGTALFFRAAGASSATRLLQIDDEVPGFPGSQIVSIFPQIGINSLRTLFFEVNFEGIVPPRSALLTYDADGKNYHTLVTSETIAPDPGNPAYGPFLVPGGIDDAGDVSFGAIPVGKSAFTYYILAARAQSAVRIAALDDPLPQDCPWCVAPGTSTSLSLENFFAGNPVSSAIIVSGPFVQSVPGLNAQGQMLLSLWRGLFIGSKANSRISTVPMGTGACSVQPVTTGTVPSSQILNGFLSNSGVVVFTDFSSSGTQAICVAPANGGPPVAAVTSGDPAPALIGGTIASPFALGISDSGDIIFQSSNGGAVVATPGTSAVLPSGLLRYHQPSGQQSPVLDVVAYAGETAPGTTPPATFLSGSSLVVVTGNLVPVDISTFSGVSMANDGRVSFRASLSSGGSGIYRQTGGFSSSNAPELIFLGDQFAPLLPVSERVSFTVSPSGQTKILESGSVFFATYLTSGAADFAEYLGAPGNLHTLMTTGDVLPSGARTLLEGSAPEAAGHFVAFAAQPAGGRINLLVSDLTANTTTRVVTDNDPALAAAHGPPGSTVLAPNFFLNENGQVAFETVAPNSILGGRGLILFGPGSVNGAWLNSTSPCAAIYLWSPSSPNQVTKVATAGDSAPVSSSTTAKFSCVSLNAGAPSPLNQAGQLAFSSSSPLQSFLPCFLCDILPNPALGVDGVFLYTPVAGGGAISEISAVNDTLPGETLITDFVPQLSVPVNPSGQVAFGAQEGAPSTGLSGVQSLFVRNGGSVHKVVSSRDTVPNSTDTFGFPHFISGLSDTGDLAFTAATGTAPDGLFLAPAGGGPIQTLALNGGAAPGGSGSTFSFAPAISIVPPSLGTFFVGGLNFFKNFAAINKESDVAFGAALAGGTANFGYFRAMHNAAGGVGALQPVLLQGQATIGGGIVDTIASASSGGGNFALGPDGALAFVNIFTGTFSTQPGLFIARPDGSLVKSLATGDIVPVKGGGTLTGLLMGKLAAGEAGKFAFFAGIRGGTAQRAIFVTSLAPGISSATVMLTAPVSGVAGQPVALSAAVSATTGTPSGNVGFFDSGVPLGTGTKAIISGQATMNMSSLAAGLHSIVAQYSGDMNFAPENSSPQTVTVAGFAPPPTNLTVARGHDLVIPLTLYGASRLSLPFTLSCSGLPANATCAFASNPVTPAMPPTGSAVQLTFSAMAASGLLPVAPRTPSFPPEVIGILLGLAALLVTGMLVFRPTPRRRLAFSACLVVLSLAAVMAGCGAVGSGSNMGPGSSGTPAGPASFTVTAASGTTTMSTVVNITVQ